MLEFPLNQLHTYYGILCDVLIFMQRMLAKKRCLVIYKLTRSTVRITKNGTSLSIEHATEMLVNITSCQSGSYCELYNMRQCMFLVIFSIDCINFSYLNYKMVIFLSQTESTPKHFFRKKKKALIIHILYKMQRTACTTSSAPLKCKWELEGLKTGYN